MYKLVWTDQEGFRYFVTGNLPTLNSLFVLLTGFTGNVVDLFDSSGAVYKSSKWVTRGYTV